MADANDGTLRYVLYNLSNNRPNNINVCVEYSVIPAICIGVDILKEWHWYLAQIAIETYVINCIMKYTKIIENNSFDILNFETIYDLR